jgi:hypothetical protein
MKAATRTSTAASAILTELAEALAEHGLILRGGFHPGAEEPALAGVGTVVLVGNAGSAMWRAFRPHIDGTPNPLDRWTRHVIEPMARKLGARAIFPSVSRTGRSSAGRDAPRASIRRRSAS